MDDSRRPHIAAEGIPLLLLLAASTAGLWMFAGMLAAMLPFVLFIVALVVFHDPRHDTPAAPRGVLSPVDGTVVEVGSMEPVTPDGEVRRVVIRINPLGIYTARAPVEGKIMDVRGEEQTRLIGTQDVGLWLRTDEGTDVALLFHGSRFGLGPRALVRYGERVGQGHPCAYLRLARVAEVRVPAESRILVEPGQRVMGGMDALAKLPAASAEVQEAATQVR